MNTQLLYLVLEVEMRRRVSLQEAVLALENLFNSRSGAFFSVVTELRTRPGELRSMNCRFHVEKYKTGGELGYDMRSKNLMSVCDMVVANTINSLKAKGIDPASVDKSFRSPYRSINLDGLREIHINNEVLEVVR